MPPDRSDKADSVRRLSRRADRHYRASLAALLPIEVIQARDLTTAERKEYRHGKKIDHRQPIFAPGCTCAATTTHRVSPVVGSMSVFTLLMTVHGNPLRRACSRITSSSSAMYTQ